MERLTLTNVNNAKYWNKVYHDEILGRRERIAMDRFSRISDMIPDGASVLDAGCGKGEFIKFLLANKPKCKITGIDISNVAIDHCEKTLPVCQFKTCDVYKMDKYLVGKYDYIISLEVFEHLEEPVLFIQQCEKILNKGGWLIITMPFMEMVDGGGEHIYSYDFEDMIKLFSIPRWQIIGLGRYHINFVNMFVLVRFCG